MRLISPPFRTTFISFFKKISIISDDLGWLEYRFQSTEQTKTFLSINRINQNINRINHNDFLLLCIKMFFGLDCFVRMELRSVDRTMIADNHRWTRRIVSFSWNSLPFVLYPCNEFNKQPVSSFSRAVKVTGQRRTIIEEWSDRNFSSVEIPNTSFHRKFLLA